MIGMPREYLNLHRPGSIIHWYKSLYLTTAKRRRDVALVLPVVAQVEPTVRCDLACTFCHSQELRRARKSPDMTIEQFRHVIDELHFLLGLGIVGMGEPTLHPDFPRMVEYANSKGICTQTVTNCNRHTLEISRLLVSTGLRQIRVSIDGATPEAYEKSRKGAQFERTIENLRRLVEYRGSRRYPRIIVQMLAFDYNYHNIPDLARLCLSIGVDELMIQGRPTDWGKNGYVDQTVSRAATTAGNDYEKALNEAKQIVTGSRLIFEDHRSHYSTDHPCRKPWSDLYVATTGDVVPCCTIADPGVMRMGNLFEQSFTDIWNGPKYVAFRKSIKDGRIPRCCFQCYSPDLLRERSQNQEENQCSQK